jgi:hypothetical protein
MEEEMVMYDKRNNIWKAYVIESRRKCIGKYDSRIKAEIAISVYKKRRCEEKHASFK